MEGARAQNGMKPTTRIYYRFRNVGTPEDTTQPAEATTWPEMGKALVAWMQRVSMNSHLVIEVRRGPFGVNIESADEADEVARLFAEAMNDAMEGID